jgi:hypothetical protein
MRGFSYVNLMGLHLHVVVVVVKTNLHLDVFRLV